MFPGVRLLASSGCRPTSAEPTNGPVHKCYRDHLLLVPQSHIFDELRPDRTAICPWGDSGFLLRD